MDADSVPKVAGNSSITSTLEPLESIHAAREINEGSTSCASSSMRGECAQVSTHLDALILGVEDDNTNDFCVTDCNVSGGCKNLKDSDFSSNSAKANTTEDGMNDVKVCDICGDVGYEEMLVICSECNEGAEHIYCMQTLLCNIPEGDWFCDDCKLKFNERDQSKAITDSPLSSLSQETEENNALKVLSSAELKLSPDKMQMQKYTGNSVECNKQKIDNSNKASVDKKQANKREIDDDNKEASANKKQATGFDNVQINASEPLHKGNSSCKVLETTRADSCGGPCQIKIPSSPRYAREGSLKMSGAGKSDSCSITTLANKNLTPRSLSRESSLKTAEMGKVKFLPMHTAATLCSGMAVRESSKFTGIDGNPDLAPSRPGSIDSCHMSSRGGSIPVTDSAVPLVNRSGYQLSVRSGLSKSDDVFPSFLLSSRSNTPRRHSNFRSSKEAIHGDGQLGLPGKTSAKLENTRSNNSRSCVPTGFNHSKDNNVNDDVNGISKPSFGTISVSIVEKSNSDASASPVCNSGSSKPDELKLAKESSHLISPSAGRCSAVPTQVLQPRGSICEEYEEDTVAKESPEKLILTNKVGEDLVSTEHSNVLHYDTQGPAGMKPVEGLINVTEFTHKKSGNQVPASVLADNDRVLTQPAVSPLMEELDALKDRLPKMDDLLLTQETVRLKSRKDDCKHPDAVSADGKVAVRVGEYVAKPVPNKQVVPGSLDKQPSEKVIPKISVKMSMDKDIVEESSLALDDNTSVASIRTTQNTFSETILGSSDGKMEIKPASKVLIRESLNSTMRNSTEANVQLPKGSFKGPSSLETNPEKHLLTTLIPHRFEREVSMESQSDKSIAQSLEINISSSAFVQSQVHSPSSEKYARGVPSQGMFGLTQQKLPTRPESWFLWRGGFEIIDKISERRICDGMQAHLSNKSSRKVYEESRKFPSQLLLEQVQRYDAWPKRFEESPPTDEDIALYIFPVEAESCKIRYFELLEATIKQDLALRVNLECAELLIFGSDQLPESYRRYNGRMYLWGVFRGRKKITLADSQLQFPDCNNVGNDVQPSTSHLLMKNNNPLPAQLTSANASGCSEGEEDMDVDMEGGREIGMAEIPAAKSETQVPNAIEDDATNMSVTSNSNYVPNHHKNLKSGNCMPFEQDGLSLVASGSNSVKILGTIPEMKESIGVDIGGERNLGVTERSNPKLESQLANRIEKSVALTSVLSNSRPKLSHQDKPKLGGIISLEQSCNSSFASRHGSTKIFGNIPEYMPSTIHVKDAERRNEQSNSCYTNDELEFPPGFELPPVCHNSSAISRSNCGKHIEAKPENMNSVGIHAKIQEGELPPELEAFSDNTKSSINYLASGFSSQHCTHPPSAVLSKEFPLGFGHGSIKGSMSFPDYPPGLEPALVKPLVSSPDCPPGLETAHMKSQFSLKPAFVKPLVSSPECPPGLETAHMKSLFSSAVCKPSLERTYIETLVSSAECPPGLESTLVKPLVTFPGRLPGLEHTSMKPLVSSPDFPPGLEPTIIKPHLFSPDCPPGLEITSKKPFVSSVECPPGLEAVSVKSSVAFPDHRTSLEPSVRNPSFRLHSSCITEPAEGMSNLSSSECPPGVEASLWNCPLTSLDHPPGFETASGKSPFPSSVHPLGHLACKQLQDKPDHEVEPIHQRSAHLLTGKDDSSGDCTKIYRANGRRGVAHTDSITYVRREVNKDTDTDNIYKHRSSREEFYHGRSRRERNDGRRAKSRSREREYDWKRSGNSSREERTRERHKNYNREEERRNERYRNYSREKKSKKEHCRKGSGEKHGTRNWERKSTERESARNRNTGFHRHGSSYVRTGRHKGYDKHSHGLNDCSHPESITRSYSAIGEKCIVDATGKTTSNHHANSSFSGSNIEHHNHKSLSLETVSANREDAATVHLDSKETIMVIDSIQLPRLEDCPLESEEKFQNIETGRNLTDEHHNHKSLSLETVSANREDAATVKLDRREAITDIDSVHSPSYCPLDYEEKLQKFEVSRILTEGHHNHKSLSLERVSANREDAATVKIDRREAIVDIDSVHLPRSEHCPLEFEEKPQNFDVRRNLTDGHHNHKSLLLERVSASREDAATVNLDRRESIAEIDSVPLPRSEYSPLESEEKLQNFEVSRNLTDGHHNHKSLSLERVSASREDAATVNLGRTEAIMEIDSVRLPSSEYSPLGSEDKSQNIEARRKLTDHHFLLWDLNDDPACENEISIQKNICGEAVQEPTQVNLSDTMISRTEYTFSHSGKVEQDFIPLQHNWTSGSRMAMRDSVKCLPLFPVNEICRTAESSANDWNYNLELGLGRRTKNKEPLALLEQSSLQSLSCNFMINENSSNFRSRSVCDDSREPSPAETSILGLSMSQYRRQGNSWVEVTKDTELSEEADADLKLTL